MKKYLIFILMLGLTSCEKDFIEPPIPQETSIFDVKQSLVTDGQDISFKVASTEKHQLVIKNEEGSVITKETFTPEVGITTRKLYTKSLPKGTLQLILLSNSVEIYKTLIILQ
jgi:hypothetical protein